MWIKLKKYPDNWIELNHLFNEVVGYYYGDRNIVYINIRFINMFTKDHYYLNSGHIHRRVYFVCG